MERVWNLELVTSVKNPQLYSRLICGVMRDYEAQGWTPLVFTFWSGNRIVGMAPLKMRKVFYTNYVCNLEDFFYSDFVFFDNYRERCMKLLVDVLFNHLNCRSATITLDTSSPNLKFLKKICLEKKLPFREKLTFGSAIIPVKTDWDQFYNSLKRTKRKEFRKIKRKLDASVSWRIYRVEIDSNAVEKILAIEQKSWKAEWRAKYNVEEDTMLRIILEASQPNGEVESIYESEVWFLEVNGVEIAYQIVLLYKGTAFFVKTSFNSNFKSFSPGKFLINGVLREVFTKGTVNKIDFITNLPFIQAWKPLCERRTQLIIEKNPFLSYVIPVVLGVRESKNRSFVFNLQLIAKVLRAFQSYLRIE
jgi:hypothetical protein